MIKLFDGWVIKADSPVQARTALNGIREDVRTAFDGIDVVERDLKGETHDAE